MNATIIFGTKNFGKTNDSSYASNEKYPNIPVVTVEGQKGAKKSRRVLFNSKAAELLGLENGTIQTLVFASLEVTEKNERGVLVANAQDIPAEVEVSYKTSKNPVAYDDSKEKGKAVTSSHVCNQVFTFLGHDDSANIEFTLSEYPNGDFRAFSFRPLTTETLTESVIESNVGTHTVEEVVNDVQAEVSRAEQASPVLQETTPDDEWEETPGETEVVNVEEVNALEEEWV